jgi:hypothetical protein
MAEPNATAMRAAAPLAHLGGPPRAAGGRCAGGSAPAGKCESNTVVTRSSGVRSAA